MALALGACAVAPAPRLAPPEASGLACGFERGTAAGLILTLYVPAGLPDEAVVVLERDGDAVGQVGVSELPELPFRLQVGDPNLSPGLEAHYACVLHRPGEPDERLLFATVVAEPPARPGAPDVSVREGDVRVDWSDSDSARVQVLRRDVLAGVASAPISPWLGEPGWDDVTVEPGRVYAYALQVAVLTEGVMWVGPLGTERYVEVP